MHPHDGAPGIQVAFYGDDFTGSTDTLYQLHRCGLSGILFVGIPDPGLLAQHAQRSVVGIAGVARALSPSEMEGEVRTALHQLADLSPRYTQYKACSTFDSSPSRGSIGRALELGREVFGTRPALIMPAQPQFGRYTIFGNHFAAGPDGTVARLDRHPTMSSHPATPMHEADLRLHLAAQTSLPVGLLDIRAVRGTEEELQAALRDAGRAAPAALLVDALTDADVERGAQLALSEELSDFGVGSGGLSYGLGRALGGKVVGASPLAPAETALVLAGSLASQTRRQVRRAVAEGWHHVELTSAEISAAAERTDPGVVARVLERLARGESVVVTSSSAEEPRGPQPASPPELARRIGVVYARILEAALVGGLVGRSAVAGGDTSGWTIQELGVDALEVVGVLDVAATVCGLRSAAPALDGAEVVLKGGQVGGDDFFSRLLTGLPAERVA